MSSSNSPEPTTCQKSETPWTFTPAIVPPTPPPPVTSLLWLWGLLILLIAFFIYRAVKHKK